MKVAANGGVNLSVLDGWWAEGYNGSNGFAIAPDNHSNNYATDSAAIRQILEHKIQPAFKGADWQALVKESMKLASFFNTRRSLEGYAKHAYGLSLEKRVATR